MADAIALKQDQAIIDKLANKIAKQAFIKGQASNPTGSNTSIPSDKKLALVPSSAKLDKDGSVVKSKHKTSVMINGKKISISDIKDKGEAKIKSDMAKSKKKAKENGEAKAMTSTALYAGAGGAVVGLLDDRLKLITSLMPNSIEEANKPMVANMAITGVSYLLSMGLKGSKMARKTALGLTIAGAVRTGANLGAKVSALDEQAAKLVAKLQ